jgi:hypothetical protein
MGKSIPVTVGDQFFPTKTALRAHVRGLIDRYSVGSFLDDADLRFCLSLFRFHSEAKAKFGSGVSRVEVRRDQYGNKHFQVHRGDGSSDDISWVHCVEQAG